MFQPYQVAPIGVWPIVRYWRQPRLVPRAEQLTTSALIEGVRLKRNEARQSHRIIRNSLYNLVPQLWMLGLTIFTMPYVLHQLGVDAYGVLSLVSIIVGYLAFLDLGLNTAIIRFIALHNAKGERTEIVRVTESALFIFLCLGGFACGTLLLLSRPLANLLDVPSHLFEETVFVLRLGAVSFGANLVLGVFAAVPRALRRFDVVNILQLVLGTTQIAGTVILLKLGFRLREVVAWGACVSCLSLMLHAFVAKRLMPEVRFTARLHRAKSKNMLSFSSYVMLSNIAAIAAGNSEKVLLGYLAPIAETTYYAIASNLASRVLLLIPSNLSHALFPEFTVLGATAPLATIQLAYRRVFKFIFMAVSPISVLLAVFGKHLLTLWLGADVSLHAAPVLAVLAAAILVNAPAWVSVTTAQSLGFSALVARAQLIHLVALIAAGFALIPTRGAHGAAFAWLVGNLVGISYLVYLITRVAVRLRLSEFLMDTLPKPSLVGILSLVVALTLDPSVSSWSSLVICTMVVLSTNAILTYWVAFDREERSLAHSFLSSHFLRSSRADTEDL
jgi:O-antigen/teichoic acid export membrane protein